jgi:hypothetical protein
VRPLKGHKPLDATSAWDCIRVEDEKVLASCQSEAYIVGPTVAEIALAPDDMHPWEAFRDISAVVTGSVIDHDDFSIETPCRAACYDCRKALREQGRDIPAYDNNRKVW